MDSFTWIRQLVDNPQRLQKYMSDEEYNHMLSLSKNQRAEYAFNVCGDSYSYITDYSETVFGMKTIKWLKQLQIPALDVLSAQIYLDENKLAPDAHEISYEQWICAEIRIETISFRAKRPVVSWFLGYIEDLYAYCIPLPDLGNRTIVTLDQVRSALHQSLRIHYKVCYVCACV